MKHAHRIICLYAYALVAILAAIGLGAQTPERFYIYKEALYLQAEAGLVVFDAASAQTGIDGVAKDSMTDLLIRDVTGGAGPLYWDPYAAAYSVWTGRTTMLNLDARFPNGTYRLSGTGTAGLGPFDVPLSLMGTYPDPPLILNYTELRETDSDKEVSVEWTAFVSAVPHRYIELEARVDVVGEPFVYHSGQLPPDTTTHTLPGDFFPKGVQIRATLRFVAASQLDPGAGPAGADLMAAYTTATAFAYPAQNPPPPPAVAFFGRDLFVFAGSDPDQSQWYFSFTFKDLYHFKGGNWFYFESFNSYLWVDIFSGSLGNGFWAYSIFPDGSASWVFLGRNGNFGDLRDTPAARIPDWAAGGQRLDGYLYLLNPLPGDPPGPAWYYFSEFADGNYLLNLKIQDPTPEDWHKLTP